MSQTTNISEFLAMAKEKALRGVGLTYDEGVEFTKIPEEHIYEILAVTDKVRRTFKGDKANTCGIINAKSGLCAEDCTFCSQSVHFPESEVPEYPMATAETIAKAAVEAQANGVGEFSIVTSGTGIVKESDIGILKDALGQIKESTDMMTCASLGIMSKERLQELKDAGLQSFHHNLETSRSFFPNICTTHSYEDDINSVKNAKELGFFTCTGGIMGMGESWEQRVELAETLQELDVDSVPINFLNPRPGTPLEGQTDLTPMKCLKIIALFRLMLPTKEILVCGGREVNLRDLQPLMFGAGANGTMVGNYLTTKGRDSEEDLQMIKDLGLVQGSAHS